MKKWFWLFLINFFSIILFIPAFSGYAAIPMPNWKTRLVNSENMEGVLADKFSIAADSSNFQHVCYVDMATHTIRYKTNSSGYWKENTVTAFDSNFILKHFDITVTTTGKVYILYSTADSLKLAVSDNPGKWEIIDLYNGACLQNSIAAGHAGKIHVSFIRDQTLYYVTSISGRWVVFTVDNSGSITGDIAMAADDAGTVHIAYYERNSRDLKYAAKLINENQWQIRPVSSLYGYNNNAPSLDISIDPSNFTHISYIKSNYPAQPYSLALVYANNKSGTWQTDVIDQWEVRRHHTCAIAVDSHGLPHIVYQGRSYLKHATNPGNGWRIQDVKLLDVESGSGAALGPVKLAADTSDFLHAVYSHFDRQNTRRQYYLTTSSQTWRADEVRNTSVGDFGYISAAGDPVRGAHITYEDNQKRIMYTHHNGDYMPPGFPFTTVVDAGGNNSNPVIGIDAGRTLHICYEKKDQGLYYAHSAAGTSGWTIEPIEPGHIPALYVEPSGRLHLAYIQDNGIVKYATRGVNEINWTFHVVAENGYLPFNARICAIQADSSGGIHMAYANPDIKLIYAYKSPDSNQWNFVPVGSRSVGTETIGFGVSQNRIIHFSYHDRNSNSFKYAKYNPNTLRIEYQTIASGTQSIGGRSSLAVDSMGRPHICYQDNSNNHYAMKYTAIGIDQPVTIDGSTRYNGYHNAITLDAAGSPYICYDLRDHFGDNPLKIVYTPYLGKRIFMANNYYGYYFQHLDGTGVIAKIDTDKDEECAIFNIVPALSKNGPGYVSLESYNYPGYYFRHENFQIKLDRFESSPDKELFKEDASFRITQPLWQEGNYWKALSLESYNYPNHYIRHKNFRLYLESEDSELFRKDATFELSLPSSHYLRYKKRTPGTYKNRLTPKVKMKTE